MAAVAAARSGSAIGYRLLVALQGRRACRTFYFGEHRPGRGRPTRGSTSPGSSPAWVAHVRPRDRAAVAGHTSGYLPGAAAAARRGTGSGSSCMLLVIPQPGRGWSWPSAGVHLHAPATCSPAFDVDPGRAPAARAAVRGAAVVGRPRARRTHPGRGVAGRSAGLRAVPVALPGDPGGLRAGHGPAAARHQRTPLFRVAADVGARRWASAMHQLQRFVECAGPRLRPPACPGGSPNGRPRAYEATADAGGHDERPRPPAPRPCHRRTQPPPSRHAVRRSVPRRPRPRRRRTL